MTTENNQLIPPADLKKVLLDCLDQTSLPLIAAEWDADSDVPCLILHLPEGSTRQQRRGLFRNLSVQLCRLGIKRQMRILWQAIRDVSQLIQQYFSRSLRPVAKFAGGMTLLLVLQTPTWAEDLLGTYCVDLHSPNEDSRAYRLAVSYVGGNSFLINGSQLNNDQTIGAVIGSATLIGEQVTLTLRTSHVGNDSPARSTSQFTLAANLSGTYDRISWTAQGQTHDSGLASVGDCNIPIADPNGIDNDQDGYTENQNDCNDSLADINPNATEVCGDGIDQDCSGEDLLCDPTCVYDGQIYDLGNQISTYANSIVEPDMSCDEILSECGDNGWSTTPGVYATCAPREYNNCIGPGGITILHDTSRRYYQSSTVPAGSTCVSQLRSCDDGNLSGTYTATSCTVDSGLPGGGEDN